MGWHVLFLLHMFVVMATVAGVHSQADTTPGHYQAFEGAVADGLRKPLWFLPGVRGYMALEYLCYGQVFTKLDVFSFGVLLLEIVSGQKKINLKLPSTKQYLVQWAQELHSIDNLPNLKDKLLEVMTMVEEATFKQVVKVGLQCLHHIVARHPTMSKVVAMLIGNKNVDDCALEDYHEGSSSKYDTRSSSFCFSTPKSSLQCIAKFDDSLHLDSESYKQSFQLCEIGLGSK